MTDTKKAKTDKLIEAIESDRWREFTSREMAEIMGCDIRAVSSMVRNAARKHLLFFRVQRRILLARGMPYPREEGSTAARPAWTPENDPRITRVVSGWQPPRMVAPRG